MTEEEPKWHHFGVNRDRGWRTGAHHLYWRPDILKALPAAIEWHLLDKGHGVGFQIGRNGQESDLGLNAYAGRIGSVWLRLRSPWTKWLKVRDQEKPHWYDARHYGVMLWPYDGCWFRLQFGEYDGMDRKARKWREPSLHPRTLLGFNKSERVEGDSGMTVVPMPEGSYPAAWKEITVTTRYTKPLGKLRDKILGPRVASWVKLDVPGGIPFEGKGENSWDCGMDGIFGTSGPTVADAVGSAVRSALRSRENYGGPHSLPRPMTVKEAEAYVYNRGS